jgi:hypothetical protein
MNPEEILQATISAILGQRHPNYKRTVEVSQWASSMINGTDQENQVTGYRILENEDLQKQRVRLYNPLTKYILARPRKYWKKIGKTPGQNLILESDNPEKLAELNQQFIKFSDNKSLMDWIVFKLEQLGCTDPNAWIIFDREDMRGTDGQIIKTHIFPWIVRSVNVVDYYYFRGTLQHLTVREIRMVRVDSGAGKVEKYLEDYYTFYPGGITKMRQITKESEVRDGERLETIQQEGKDDLLYAVSDIQNGTTEVPAICAGAYPDDQTRQETFTTWFDPAEHVLKDVIRDKSISDVVRIVHAFRKRWEYVKPCTDSHEKLGACIKGWYNGIRDEAHRCQTCGGHGRALFTSEQQVNQLAMPTEANALMELNKLAFEEPVDITLPQFYEDMVDKDTERVMKAVLSAGVIEMATGSGTATEQNYSYEALYDTLEPFEQKVSLTLELAYRVGAQYMEFDIRVDHRFPKDKRMKPLTELFGEMQLAKSSGAGYDAQRVIFENIIYKLNEDNPEEVTWMLARYDWQPWADKTEEQKTVIITSRAPNDPERVLYENFLAIFREIEVEQPDFAQMTYEMQKQIVDAKVAEFAQKIITLNGETFQPIPA